MSASKWEVSDNEARMGEFDEDPIGRDKSVGKWTNADKDMISAKLDGTTEKVKSRLAQHTSIEV